MSTPKAPKTPDPNVQIAAESAANRYNINAPGGGSQTWEQGPRVVTGYDSKGKPIYGNQATQTIKLGDAEQQQYDTRNEIANNLLTSANEQLPGFTDSPFSFNDQGHTAATAQFDRQKAYLEPEFKKNTENFEDRMANAGIPVGSEAYQEALRGHENNQNFALTQAAQQAEQTGSQLGLSERQQRYNELAAAMGSQQLNGVQAFGTQGAQLDAAGAYQNANDAALAKYNAQQSGMNSLIGGLGGLGAAAIQYSDERLKDDIEEIGSLPTGEGVYEYSYKFEPDGAEKHTGVMAQEISTNYPDAVLDTESGYKAVDYRKLISQAMRAEAA